MSDPALKSARRKRALRELNKAAEMFWRGARWSAQQELIFKLQNKNRALREDLREYGRHKEGCTGQWPEYPCKCGWREVAKKLEGK